MYNYELYIAGYEGAIRVFLQHEKLYTDTQFKDLVTDVFVNVCKEKIKKRIEEFPEENPIKELWGEDIFADVHESLLTNYGFKEPIYTANFSMIGYADFFNKEENTHDDMIELIKTKLWKKWQVWTEGYTATGNSCNAYFHGEFEGETFKDAVVAWKNTLTDEYSIKGVDIERMTFWGCGFFDNE